MSRQLLIDSLVRQMTVLLASLATAGGRRAPLAHVAEQVFLDLASEIEAQGVGKKVSADMFGLALRTYQRKVQRLKESSTRRGASLWQSIIDELQSHPRMTRQEIARTFSADDEVFVGAILHDLRESGLVKSSREDGEEAFELVPHPHVDVRSDVEDFVRVVVYREGPLSIEELSEMLRLPTEQISGPVTKLLTDGVLSQHRDGRLSSSRGFIIPYSSDAGWEAAVLDHFSALVTTLCAKLNQSPVASPVDATGGSTFSMEIWGGHPLADKVKTSLERMRAELSSIRQEVRTYNETHGTEIERQRVTIYVGQHVLDMSSNESS